MATRLFFHDTTNDQAGTYPAGEQSSFTPTQSAAGASTLRKMNTTIGTFEVSPGNTPTTGQTASQSTFYRFFTSPPLDGAQTVGGGTAILNTADAESNIAANHWIDSVNIYVWRPSTGAKIGVVRDAQSLGGSEPSAASSEQVTHLGAITTSAIAAIDGDVVICEVWAEFAQGMAASYNTNFFYDGTTVNLTENLVVTGIHASFVELAETLTFQSPPPSGPPIGLAAQCGCGL